MRRPGSLAGAAKLRPARRGGSRVSFDVTGEEKEEAEVSPGDPTPPARKNGRFQGCMALPGEFWTLGSFQEERLVSAAA